MDREAAARAMERSEDERVQTDLAQGRRVVWRSYKKEGRWYFQRGPYLIVKWFAADRGNRITQYALAYEGLSHPVIVTSLNEAKRQAVDHARLMVARRENAEKGSDPDKSPIHVEVSR